MTVSEAVISGVVQGITEFLPVSSSGHLVILHHYLGIKEPQILFDIFLHVGTLLATVVFFWKDIISIGREGGKLGLLLLTGLVPTGIIGLLLHNFAERSFVNVHLVGLMLIITGLWLLAASIRPGKNLPVKNSRWPGFKFWQALVIGISQGIAVMPGISRSGATIATGLLCGVEKETAARYSFLLSIPAIIGVVLLKLNTGSIEHINIGIVPLLFGTVTAAVVGFFSIALLLSILKRWKLYVFSIYCFAIGLAVLIIR